MGAEADIVKLQESQAFTERAIEQLSAEVRDLGSRIAELASALKRLEARLSGMTEHEDDSGQE